MKKEIKKYKNYKVLHAASMIEKSDGIFNQMRMEYQEVENRKLLWDTKIYCNEKKIPTDNLIENPKSSYIKKNNKWSILTQIKFAIEYTKWLKKQEVNYDVLILRYRVYSFPQLYFMLTKKTKVFLVHHTLELDELSTINSFSFKIKKYMELIFGIFSIRMSDGIIGVTEEIANYEKNRARAPNKKTIVMPNGFKYQTSDLIDNRKLTPEFIFVASYFSPWHGLDRLIKAAHESSDNFILHVIGNVNEIDYLSAKNDSRIIFHGKKTQPEIRDISENCWIGLASFGLDRNNMTEACTLKVREYLASGLPVFSGHKDVFPSDFEYYKYSENKICIKEIIDFAISHRHKKRSEISEAARPYIDKINIIKNTYELLNK